MLGRACDSLVAEPARRRVGGSIGSARGGFVSDEIAAAAAGEALCVEQSGLSAPAVARVPEALGLKIAIMVR